jgi:Xaa-Pro aminopeptidase
MATPSSAVPGALPPLVPMDVASRAGRVRRALDGAGVDALVVTKGHNVRWLTGFTGSNGRLVVTAEALLVVTDGRYRTQVAQQLDAAGVEAEVEITTTGVGEVLAGALPEGTRVGLEAHHVSWKERDQMVAWLPERELVPVDGLVEEKRKVKDEGERSRLVRGAAITDLALASVRHLLEERPTEVEVARLLDHTMAELGADAPSFDTIVASGPNSALPHARPTDRVLEPGDLVIIDVGARVDGYGSDMTRTFVVGGDPDPEQRRWYDAVAEAQAAGVAAVADGVEIRSVDAVCRQVLEGHGLGEAFVHGTGHGIGLEIHEDPILSARTDGILRAGYVVTVEPGVYLPPHGGVRIEDSVVVGPTSCEAITLSPKSPN